jgi:beta-mannosidase
MINGNLTGTGRNAFIGHRFVLSGLLKKGLNTIEIIISSAEKEALEIKSRLAYPIPHMSYPVQSEGRNLIRKTQCHAGWDWGPCLMVSGIYGNTLVKSSGLEIIEAVHTSATPVDGSLKEWNIDINIDLICSDEGETIVKVACAGVENNQKFNLGKGEQTLNLKMKIHDPELWWPAGYGKQPLYDLVIKTSNDSANRKIGFRKAEVITGTDEHGIGMKVKINNREIFCKGANWIPADSLPSRQSPDRYQSLISSAADANMNMLRIWGGGQYEADSFYDLCDEKGIMIWQDFMFACSVYPADEVFLENVRKEAEYQVKRLKTHPSIVLWCGNNENVGTLNWFDETKKNRDRYIIDYDKLNEGILGKTVKSLILTVNGGHPPRQPVREIILTAGTMTQKVICTTGASGMRENRSKHITMLYQDFVPSSGFNHFHLLKPLKPMRTKTR